MTERQDRLPPGASPRQALAFRVRSILRHIPGVMLFRDASALPVGSKYLIEIGYPDIVGSYRVRGAPQPFAFIVQPYGEKMQGTREHWLVRLRGHGWITAVVSDPADAKAALMIKADT